MKCALAEEIAFIESQKYLFLPCASIKGGSNFDILLFLSTTGDIMDDAMDASRRLLQRALLVGNAFS